MRTPKTSKWHDHTLASGNIAYKGSALVYNTTTNKVQVATGTHAPNLVFIGHAARKINASSADKTVPVEYPSTLDFEFFENATAGDAVAATDMFRSAYLTDDQTVSTVPTGRTRVGRVWGLDSRLGVLVEKQVTAPSSGATLPAVAAFTAADYAPAALQNGAIYDVPTTAANSTITLPAAAPDGTIVYFLADGTKNGHTVTYRDATGPVTLSAAATASKRHLCIAVKREAKWSTNLSVAP